MSLAAEFLQRAAPPGSTRYFALLYATPTERELLSTLFVIDSEIRASIYAAHEVAHTRLQWWRTEIDRLINRNAQHPATQALQSALPNADFSVLHEVLVAADMDVACMTYQTKAELDAYLIRSGTVYEFAAQPSPEARLHARQLGTLLRRVETLRDLSIEAKAGRVYLPFDELDTRKITLENLRSTQPPKLLIDLVAAEVQRVATELNAIPLVSRPLTVLGQLHARLLTQITAADHDVFSQRHELGPLRKVWTAWRAARRVN
jgi:15-cis-phytoene synthase